MNTTTIYRYLFAAAAFATLTLAACSDIDRDRVPARVNGPAELRVEVQLDDARTETRADGDGTADDNDNGYDNWSYRGFPEDTELGFFSPHGDYEKIQQNLDDALVNVKLVYKDNFSSFGNPEIQFSPSFLDDPGKCFIYMPYGGMRDNPVFELRSNRGGDGILRCIDYLQTQNNLDLSVSADGQSATIKGTMAHSFSELIIMRGTGFDKPKEGLDQITVVLTNGFSHMKIEVPDAAQRAEGEWYCKPTLIHDPNYAMNEQACSRWVAWQGNKFLRTDKNNIGVDAWYAILPTLPGNYSTVAYIELYDNEGQQQRVTAVKLQHHDEINRDKLLAVDKQLYPGWRYPIEIMMDELVPTINPYPILSWNIGNDGKDTNITNERKRGITNQNNFGMWLQTYIQYLKGVDNTNELLQYGDLTHYEEDNRDVWHFYLLSDIDLANYNYNDISNGVLIPELNDILDGRSTTLHNHEFENYKLKNLKVPLVGNLTGNGQLLNMDFEKPDIRVSYEYPVGTLVNSVDGGTIDNCNIIDGNIVTSGPVGMIAGEVNSGTVINCSASGFVVGSESYRSESDRTKYLFGTAPADGSVINGNTSKDVVYSDSDSEPNN